MQFRKPMFQLFQIEYKLWLNQCKSHDFYCTPFTKTKQIRFSISSSKQNKTNGIEFLGKKLNLLKWLLDFDDKN